MTLKNELSKALRVLSMDAVEKAESGHPGMPLGMADIATVLWHQFLRHHPQNPSWFNRDRFVLSNGHGSMLLYALLHLTGYALSLEDLKAFRQLHSKTPGHPEYGETPGVEVTTGPLGQGLAAATGMAIAEKMLATKFNRDGCVLVDHFTYVFAGDGCMMEGISHEAASLAGTLGLEKLIVFYDDNGISIDGKVESWFKDDTALRFKAYHWQVIGPIDGHDMSEIEAAILKAHANKEQPSLIICKTIIGFASTLAGSEKSHGAPLGAEGISQVRKNLNWPYSPFEMPDEIYAQWNHVEQGQHDENNWLLACQAYQKRYPEEYAEFLRRINGDLPDNFENLVKAFTESLKEKKGPMATRKCSWFCIENLAPLLPELIGGSADLTASNNTDWSGTQAISAEDFSGNYIFYGVREFAMAALMNGLAVHGGFIPYGGTFLVFTDYARGAIRLAALMKIRVLYILTHDSIGLGEDGPTHQPVEHAAILRMTPNIQVWRPADLLETAASWYFSLNHRRGPSALLLSRQNLPVLSHDAEAFDNIGKGGYILKDCKGEPDLILIATGSELQLALLAAEHAQLQNLAIRVVSMPCCERFLAQEKRWQEQVLPNAVRKRVVIEAAATTYWYRFAGLDGLVIGLDSFGASAPFEKALAHFGFSVETIVEKIAVYLKTVNR